MQQWRVMFTVLSHCFFPSAGWTIEFVRIINFLTFEWINLSACLLSCLNSSPWYEEFSCLIFNGNITRTKRKLIFSPLLWVGPDLIVGDKIIQINQTAPLIYVLSLVSFIPNEEVVFFIRNSSSSLLWISKVCHQTIAQSISRQCQTGISETGRKNGQEIDSADCNSSFLPPFILYLK